MPDATVVKSSENGAETIVIEQGPLFGKRELAEFLMHVLCRRNLWNPP
jgi:hypothetical protein